MQKELLKQYAKLETKFKELEAEKQALRESIVVEMKKNKLDKVESDYGNFTVCSKSSWKYSTAITAKEEALKIAKTREQEKGLATSTTSEYLLYKASLN